MSRFRRNNEEIALGLSKDEAIIRREDAAKTATPKRFRRTKAELEAGLTVEEAQAARETEAVTV